jgi:hypothetical protein
MNSPSIGIWKMCRRKVSSYRVAKRVRADEAARRADVTALSEAGGLLNRNAGLGASRAWVCRGRQPFV